MPGFGHAALAMSSGEKCTLKNTLLTNLVNVKYKNAIDEATSDGLAEGGKQGTKCAASVREVL